MSKFVYKQNTTKPDKRIWDEFVEVDESGNETGRSTLNIVTPTKISSYDTCDHEYEYRDNGNSAVCRKCEVGQRIVLGIHKIVDGKIVTKLPESIKDNTDSVE